MAFKLTRANITRLKFRILIVFVLVLQIASLVIHYLLSDSSFIDGFNGVFVSTRSIHQFIIGYGHLFLLVILVVLLFSGYHYEIRQKTRLLDHVQKAELKALKAQIQPHFLFNTLNTILYQIREHPEKASETVRELADLFRYILQASDKEMNSLDQEIKFISKYLDIEKSRFGGRLSLIVDLPPKWLSRKVPVLILQPLIENSIRHGLFDAIHQGVITITSDISSSGESIVVMDNGLGFKEVFTDKTSLSQGYGLKNVNDRWVLLTGNPIRVESMKNATTRIYLDW